METEADSNDLRVASFSVYLNSAEENFEHHKHGVSVQNLSPTSIVFPLSEDTPALTSIGKIVSSGEIGVLDAEKYHNIDGRTAILDYKKGNRTDPCRNNSKCRLGAPRVSSKASMSSKTVLLSKTEGGKQSNVNGKSFFSRFSCKNFCVDRKSICVSKNTKGRGKNHEDITNDNVKIEESVMMDDKEESKAKIQIKNEFSSQESRKVGIGTNRVGGHFSFPTHNHRLQNVSVGAKHDGFTSNEEEDSSRTSLEVFGTSHVNKNTDVVVMNLGRKLSMLTWDAIPRSQSLPTSSKSRVTNDDLESDASSDLFEIENLLSTGLVSPFLARQASDGGFPQYAPSERSIEWSVVTASAADFSAVSDRDEKDVSENVKVALEPATDTSRSQQGGNGV